MWSASRRLSMVPCADFHGTDSPAVRRSISSPACLLRAGIGPARSFARWASTSSQNLPGVAATYRIIRFFHRSTFCGVERAQLGDVRRAPRNLFAIFLRAVVSSAERYVYCGS